MIPLHLMAGDWADYHSTSLKGGRRSESTVRVQCIGSTETADGRSWLIELIPLSEQTSGLVPIPGEGLLLQLADGILRREGALLELTERVVQWEDGMARELSPEQWRDDPLVASSLESEFQPESVEMTGSTNRMLGRQKLACDIFELADADTQRISLPHGAMEQIVRWEVTAEVNSEVPFFGVVFISERTSSQSRLDPPSARFTPPAPVIEVETMELIGYGSGADAILADKLPD
ncbi:MAG: hypothetical protein ABIF77_07630 [bacterium]